MLDDVISVLVLNEGLERSEDLRQHCGPLVGVHVLQDPLDDAATVRVTAQLSYLDTKKHTFMIVRDRGV